MKNALILFVKYPQPGKVKTRLAQSVGFEKAAKMYKELVEKNVREIRSLSPSVCDCWIAYDPPDHEGPTRLWLGQDFDYLAQQGEDLTQRLTHATSQLFERGYESVAVLGSDTQNLSSALICQGFEELKKYDVVIGPARDGGYYLIGLKQNDPMIFKGIAWSTSTVLKETIAKIKALKWEHYLLKELSDLDELTDVTA